MIDDEGGPVAKTSTYVVQWEMGDLRGSTRVRILGWVLILSSVQDLLDRSVVSSHAGVDDRLTPNCAGRCPSAATAGRAGHRREDRAAIHRRPVPARPAHPAQYPRPQRNHVRDGRRRGGDSHQRRPARAPGPRSRPTGSGTRRPRRHAGRPGDHLGRRALDRGAGRSRWKRGIFIVGIFADLEGADVATIMGRFAAAIGLGSLVLAAGLAWFVAGRLLSPRGTCATRPTRSVRPT